MASLKQKSIGHLQKMVKGAAHAQKTRDKGKEVKAETKEKACGSVEEPSPNLARGISPQTADQLKEQLKTLGRSLQAIPLPLIDLGENIRKSYTPEALRQLEDSLKADGLIQYPTVCMKEKNGALVFVCKNGHRRIQAAKNLGWERIECVVLPFDTVRNELYHTINANMREDVFYLDLAHAYEQAALLGETDGDIGGRVGVNPRTVRWYRRLTAFSTACEALVRQNPALFNATWAIHLVRKGELPEPSLLLSNMEAMQKAGRSWVEMRDMAVERQGASIEDPADLARAEKARVNLKKMFGGRHGQQNALWARNFLLQLVEGGFLPKKYMIAISKAVIEEENSLQGVEEKETTTSRDNGRA